MTTDPRRAPDNLYATAAVLFGLIGVVLGFTSLLLGGLMFGVAGLVLSTAAIGRAVRIDYAMARSLTGLSLSFLAVVVWVFTRGMG